MTAATPPFTASQRPIQELLDLTDRREQIDVGVVSAHELICKFGEHARNPTVRLDGENLLIQGYPHGPILGFDHHNNRESTCRPTIA